MKLALCNEVVRELPFERQCAFAAELGYHGLEVAPFLFGDEPHRLPAGERRRLRRLAADAGVAVSGLHWLLVAPPGLSLNGPDADLRRRTGEVLKDLVRLCADLGGRYMVHGSPQQRSVAPGDDPAEARRRALAVFAEVAPVAEELGVTYCIEPLSRRETNFINLLDEGVAFARDVGSPAFKTMIDTSAAALNGEDPAELVRRWVPEGMIGHIQVNDSNRHAPGQGADRFLPVFRALKDTAYDGFVAVEPFDYRPDGPAQAAWSAGYIRGILEALES